MSEGRDDTLSRALSQAQEVIRETGGDMSRDLEPVLQVALARSGLSWTLLEHRIDGEDGDSPVLHAKFQLAHRGSKQERTVEFSIPINSSELDPTAKRNAIAYLWIHALREVLHVPGKPGDDKAMHLQPTMRIPKIED